MRYLHFDLDTDHEAHRELSSLLLSLGAKPNATPTTLSLPIRLKSELETYLPGALQLLDEMDADPCSIELRHVLAHMSPDETLVTRDRANGRWNTANTGYIASTPRTTEIIHIITLPKRGSQPPVAISDNAWSCSDVGGTWEYRWRKTSNANGDIRSAFRRDREKIASFFRGVNGVTISSTLEQVEARWSYPLEHTEDKLHRFSFPRFVGASVETDWHRRSRRRSEDL